MIARGRRPGQPLVVLGAVLALWMAGRAMLWQSPLAADPHGPAGPGLAQWPVIAGGPASVRLPVSAPLAGPRPVAAPAAAAFGWQASADPAPARLAATLFDPSAMASRGRPIAESTAHQLMWLAALQFAPGGADPPPRGGFGEEPAPAALPGVAGPAPARPGRRWSASGWVFLRGGPAGVAAGTVAPPAYGASQAGAVLQYRLAPASPLRLSAHVRVAAALERRDERELAAGLALRPVRAVPVAVLGELRLRESAGGGVAARPAAMAVTELAPVQLGRGATAETYLQAGYVAGEGATAFADGQLRLTAGLARLGPARLRAGAAGWGGAQRGAARLDLGPTAQVDLDLGALPARLALDYRARVAGDAAPGSGVALTLSTGF